MSDASNRPTDHRSNPTQEENTKEDFLAQQVLTYYQRYRKQYPLADGWSEQIVQSQEHSRSDILLENPTYRCDLRIRDEMDFAPDDYGVYLYVLRRDRQLLTEEEALSVAMLLYGEGTKPRPNTDFVAEGYNPEGTFQVLWPAFGPEEEPGEHFGVEVFFPYPPEEIGEPHDLSCRYAREALAYYQNLRKLYPLPSGWTESKHGNPADPAQVDCIIVDGPEHRVYIDLYEADNYATDEGKPDIKVYVTRKDRCEPALDEALDLVRSLLDPGPGPNPYRVINIAGPLTPNPTQPHRFDYQACGFLAEELEEVQGRLRPKDPEVYWADEVQLTYPPDHFA